MPVLVRPTIRIAVAAFASLLLGAGPVLAQGVSWNRGHRTDRTPLDRKASNSPRPHQAGAPVNAHAQDQPTPPDSDPRAVRPAQAFPPDRVQVPREPEALPGRDRSGDPGAGAPDARLQDDPRAVEGRRDPAL